MLKNYTFLINTQSLYPPATKIYFLYDIIPKEDRDYFICYNLLNLLNG